MRTSKYKDEELKIMAEEAINRLTSNREILRADLNIKDLFNEMKDNFADLTYYYMLKPVVKDVLDAYKDEIKKEIAAQTYPSKNEIAFGTHFNAEYYIRMYKDDYPAGIREIGRKVNELIVLYSSCQLANSELRAEKIQLLRKQDAESSTVKLQRSKEENRHLKEENAELKKELEGFKQEARELVLVDIGRLKKKITISNQGVKEHTYLGKSDNKQTIEK